MLDTRRIVARMTLKSNFDVFVFYASL